MQRNPPFNLILTLEAVTRLGSFRAAADELLLTPSAVSHRVRALEDMLGRRLFDRVGQGVQATAHATRLAEIVGKAKGEIDDAWQDIQSERAPELVRVSCLAAFAGNHLLDDMSEFRRRFPTFELELATALYKGTPKELRNDIIISCGPTPGPDWTTTMIGPLEMQAIMARDPAAPFVVNGTLKGPLLSYGGGTEQWPQIAELLGLELHPDAMIITLDSVEAATIAAERGVGVALAPVATTQRLVASGRVLPIGAPLATGLNYWIATKRNRAASPSIEGFRIWLLAKAAAPLRQPEQDAPLEPRVPQSGRTVAA